MSNAPTESETGGTPTPHTAGSHDYLYSRIAAALRHDIRSGSLKAGARLPSADELTLRYKVNKGTIRRAMAELMAERLIYAIPAQGTYVAEEPPPEARRRRTSALTIGLVSTVLQGAAFGPSDAEILAGLYKEMAKRHCNLVLLPVTRSQSPAKVAEWIVQSHLDGLICLEAFEPVLLRRILQVGPPAVVVNFHPRGHGVDSVLVDNRGGARQAIAHLYALGHRNFLVITGPPELPATEERVSGVREAMKDYSIPATKLLMVSGDFRCDGGYAAMAAAVKSRTKATAVFCFNDEMAVGALQAIHKHTDWRVPQDVSVVGFDDISWAQAANPPLTTIRSDKVAMGRLAVEHLLARIRGNTSNATSTALETELVIRESTGPARRRR